MSRSHRHTRILPATGRHKSEKQDKVIYHQALRQAIRQQLHIHGQETEILPHFRDYSNPYKWSKDGCIAWDPIYGPNWYSRQPWHWWIK